MPPKLSTSQTMALEHITQYARNNKAEAEQIITDIAQKSNVGRNTLQDAVIKLKKHARVALQFHPDRPDPTMKSVAEALLEQGIYKNQFETLLSNGSVSAYPGGERDVWEEKLFGGAHQINGSTHRERPKYGALNAMLHPDGPSPRFGSCYFLLSQRFLRDVHTLIWIRIKTPWKRVRMRHWI